jgi:hypothetical protein
MHVQASSAFLHTILNDELWLMIKFNMKIKVTRTSELFLYKDFCLNRGNMVKIYIFYGFKNDKTYSVQVFI